MSPSAVEPSKASLAKVAAFDAWADEAFERLLRHRSAVDHLMYGASAIGDHGALWLILAAGQAVRHRDGRWQRPLLRAALGLVAESILVNGPIKFIFRRTRPQPVGPRPMHLRIPRTSSFPSGHASAAFFGAALLRDDDSWWPLYYAIAVVVALSRVHVRIHHASDVVGGAVVGAVLGEVTRRLVPPSPPSEGGTE
jgi:undecaprenyl-diphosphatase